MNRPHQHQSTAYTTDHYAPRKRLATIVTGLLIVYLVLAAQPTLAQDITVYKSPTCGCCSKWVKHLKANGFEVQSINRNDMPSVKQQLDVPRNYQSCHTATVGNYIIEGHVPAADIKRLLKEKPAIRGLAVPGMPMGSPGMEGPHTDRYAVIGFDGMGKDAVFQQY